MKRIKAAVSELFDEAHEGKLRLTSSEQDDG
jgi:hypothetical protein